MILLMSLALLQIPEADLDTQRGGRDVFPPAFHGAWAATLAECRDIGYVIISLDRFTGYESDAVLLKNGGMILHSTPDGREAYTMNALVAQSGEGEVGIGRLRVSRVGDRLYTSNAEVVSEEEHWSYPRVRCPDGAVGPQ